MTTNFLGNEMAPNNRKNKETVLVLGSGGAIGREVVQMLAKRSSTLNLRVFDLDTPRNRDFFDRYHEKLEAFYGDITESDTLEDAVEGVDSIIHLASLIPPKAHEWPELARKVNVEGTQNLLQAAKALAPDAFILMGSSVAVYGDRFLDPYIKVGDPLTPALGDNYAYTKIEMEKLIQESGLSYSIFRLAAIMGASNHVMSGLMFRMPLKQVMEICTPKDTARAFVYALNHQETLSGNIYNLGGGLACTTTYGDFLTENFQIYGLGALDFPLHAFATKNFHCGYFVDGDELEQILHFRRDTLEDYYSQLRQHISAPQRWATRLVRKQVKSYLLSKSEPYQAWIEGDEEKMSIYFQ